MPMRSSMRLPVATSMFRPAIVSCTSTAQRTASDDAGEFQQHAVAGGLDDAAVMLGDLRIEELAAQRFEACVRALLVGAHQPRIPRHIGGENCGEAADRSHLRPVVA